MFTENTKLVFLGIFLAAMVQHLYLYDWSNLLVWITTTSIINADPHVKLIIQDQKSPEKLDPSYENGRFIGSLDTLSKLVFEKPLSLALAHGGPHHYPSVLAHDIVKSVAERKNIPYEIVNCHYKLGQCQHQFQLKDLPILYLYHGSFKNPFVFSGEFTKLRVESFVAGIENPTLNNRFLHKIGRFSFTYKIKDDRLSKTQYWNVLKIMEKYFATNTEFHIETGAEKNILELTTSRGVYYHTDIATTLRFLSFHIPPEPIVYFDFMSSNETATDIDVKETKLTNNFHVENLMSSIENLTSTPYLSLDVCSFDLRSKIQDLGLRIDHGDTRNLTLPIEETPLVTLNRVSTEQNATMQSKLHKVRKFGSVYSNSTTAAIKIIDDIDKIYDREATFLILWVHKPGNAFSSSNYGPGLLQLAHKLKKCKQVEILKYLVRGDPSELVLPEKVPSLIFLSKVTGNSLIFDRGVEYEEFLTFLLEYVILDGERKSSHDLLDCIQNAVQG